LCERRLSKEQRDSNIIIIIGSSENQFFIILFFLQTKAVLNANRTPLLKNKYLLQHILRGEGEDTTLSQGGPTEAIVLTSIFCGVD